MDALPRPVQVPAPPAPAAISPLVQQLADREAALRLKKDAETDKANPDVSKIGLYDAELALLRQDRIAQHALELEHERERLRIATAARIAEVTLETRQVERDIANAAAGFPRDEVVEEHRAFEHRELNQTWGMLQSIFSGFFFTSSSCSDILFYDFIFVCSPQTDLFKFGFNLFKTNFDSGSKQQLLEHAPLLQANPPDSRLKSE